MAKQNSFYKRTTRGALKSIEKQLVENISNICETYNVDPSTLDVANSIDELQDLKDVLELTHGKVSSTSKKTTPPKSNTSIESGNVDDVEQSDSTSASEFDQPEPVEPNVPTPGNEAPKFNLGDFVPQENSNAFAMEFESKGRDYAKGIIETGDSTINQNDDSVPTRSSEVDDLSDSSEATSSAPDDSTPSPWQVDTSDEVEVKNRDQQVEEDSKSDDPEKVALASATKKKATKHIAKQAASMYAIVVEKTGNWAGQISEKSLDKMEAEGTIDRQYVIDDFSNQTVDQFVDNHNNQLKDVVTLDEDVKEDFQEALELVMEKHQWEVTPEVNLAIVAISGIATVVKQGRDLRKDTMRVLEKASKTYQIVHHELVQQQDENASLKAEIERLNQSKQSSVVKQEPVNGGEIESIQPEEILRKGSFKKEFSGEDVERSNEFGEATNEIDSVTSPITEDPRVVTLAKQKKRNKVKKPVKK